MCVKCKNVIPAPAVIAWTNQYVICEYAKAMIQFVARYQQESWATVTNPRITSWYLTTSPDCVCICFRRLVTEREHIDNSTLSLICVRDNARFIVSFPRSCVLHNIRMTSLPVLPKSFPNDSSYTMCALCYLQRSHIKIDVFRSEICRAKI